MCVCYANSDHCRVYISCMKTVLDLAFKLEEVVLAQVYFLYLQPNGFLNNHLEVLYYLFIPLLILINMTATFNYFNFVLSFILTKMKLNKMRLLCL